MVLTPPTQELLSVAMQLEWCRSARGNEAPHLPKPTGCVRTHLSYVYSLSPTPFCCLGKTGNVSLSWDPAGHNVTTGSLLMCPEVFLRPKPGLYHTAGRKPTRVWHHMLPAMHCSSGGSPSPGLGSLHLDLAREHQVQHPSDSSGLQGDGNRTLFCQKQRRNPVQPQGCSC